MKKPILIPVRHFLLTCLLALMLSAALFAPSGAEAVATSLSAGSNHTGLIKPDGSLWGWGSNSFGQLGDGSNTFQVEPVDVSSGQSWLKQSKGSFHSVALDVDGHLWAWGRNYEGQFGDGSSIDPKTNPRDIDQSKPGSSYLPFLVDPMSIWIDVAAGGRHTLGIKVDGTLWGWGANDFGQAGDGTLTTNYAPVLINGTEQWLAVSAGDNFSLAVRSDHKVFAWGNNFYGQLGDNSTTDHSTPTEIGIDLNWVQIAAGREFALAIDNTGALYAWGSNLHGEIARDPSVVSQVNLPILIDYGPWLTADAGGAHVGGIKADGTLWMWGSNLYGQLGEGASGNSVTSPMQVGNANAWVALALGEDHTVALLDDPATPAPAIGDQLFGFGSNASGQVGDGTTVTASAPVLVIPDVNDTAPQKLIMTVITPTNVSTQRITGTMDADVVGIDIYLYDFVLRQYDFLGPASLNSVEGTWYYDIVVPLAEGTNQLAAIATDGSSPISQVRKSIVYDNEAPIISASSPILTRYSEHLVTGIASDDNAINNVKLTGDPSLIIGTISTTNNSWQCLVSNLTPGFNTLTVDVTDLAGNDGAPATVIIEYDNVPPNTPEVFGPAYSTSARPAWSWNSKGGGMVSPTFRYRLDLGPFSADTTATNYTPVIDLADGDHVLEVQERDLAGNWSTFGFFTVLVDTQRPSVLILSPISVTPINSATPLLQYSVSDGAGSGIATVFVKIDNGPLQVIASDVNLPPLSDGEHSVEIIASDLAGNVSIGGSVNFTIDTLPPALVSPLSDITGLPDYGLSGQVEDGATVTITSGVGGGTALLSTVSLPPSWSYYLMGLAEGANPVTVTATDAAGNTTVQTLTISYDSTPPQISFISPQNGNAYNSTVSLAYTVVEPHETVRKVMLTGPFGTSDVTSDGNNFNLTTEGLYTFAVTIDDVVGRSTTESVSFTIDKTPPVPPRVSGSAPSSNRRPQWTWSSPDGDVNFQYRLGSDPFTATTATSFIPTSDLADGSYTLEVQVRDLAGNWSASGTAVVWVDNVRPSVSVTSPVSLLSTNAPVLVYNSSDASGSGVAATEVRVDDVGGSWQVMASGSSLLPLSDGGHFVDVRAIDLAGNISFLNRVDFSVDTVPPAPPLVSGPGPVISNPRPLWTWSSPSADINFRYRLDSDPFVETTVTTFQPPADLPDGNHVLEVQVRDLAGNWSLSGTASVQVDTQLPFLGLLGGDVATNDPSHMLTISGTADPGTTVTVSPTPGVAGFATFSLAPNDNIWTFDLSGLSEGITSVTVTAEDGAGNQAPPQTMKVIYDSTLPVISIGSPQNGLIYNALVPLEYIVTEANENSRTVTLAGPGGSIDVVGLPPQELDLLDGAYTLTITVVDVAGNQVESSVVFYVDRYAPTVTIDTVNSPTNQLSQTLHGTRDSGSTVNVTAANSMASVGAVVYPTLTTWSCPVSDLHAGVNVFEVTVTDITGTTGVSPVTTEIFLAGIEVQQTVIDGTWRTLSSTIPLKKPVVITSPPTAKDAETGVVRVRNVSATSFDLRFAEWRTPTGSHGSEDVSCLLLEAGIYNMDDGSVWEVGTFDLANNDVVSKTFISTFPDAPALYLTLQTENDVQPVALRAENVSDTGFDVSLTPAEASVSIAHLKETVGYLAIYRPANANGNASFGVTSLPYLVQTKTVRINDTWTPVSSRVMRLEEETTLDAETAHVIENVDVMVIGQGVFAQVVSIAEIDAVTVRQQAAAPLAPVEFGSLRLTGSNWVRIPFGRQFSQTPVVVIKPLSRTVGNAGYVQIQNVSTSAFEVRYSEWDGGPPPALIDAFYLAAEEGSQTFAGLQLQAGSSTLSSVLNSSFSNSISLSFPSSFVGPAPVLFASLQSAADSADPVISRLMSVTNVGFAVGMQEPRNGDGIHVNETVGWIAVQQGQGQLTDGRTLRAFTSSVGDDPTLLSFSALFASSYTSALVSPQFARLFPNVTKALGQRSFASQVQGRAPILLADMVSAQDTDPAVVRFDSLSNVSVNLLVEEEPAFAGDTVHQAEDISVLLLQ